jgi:hypothetical protein
MPVRAIPECPVAGAPEYELLTSAVMVVPLPTLSRRVDAVSLPLPASIVLIPDG